LAAVSDPSVATAIVVYMVWIEAAEQPPVILTEG
jgi:hypothetical protein